MKYGRDLEDVGTFDGGCMDCDVCGLTSTPTRDIIYGGDSSEGIDLCVYCYVNKYGVQNLIQNYPRVKLN